MVYVWNVYIYIYVQKKSRDHRYIPTIWLWKSVQDESTYVTSVSIHGSSFCIRKLFFSSQKKWCSKGTRHWGPTKHLHPCWVVLAIIQVVFPSPSRRLKPATVLRYESQRGGAKSILTVPEERWTLNKTWLFGLSLRIQIYPKKGNSVFRFWG